MKLHLAALLALSLATGCAAPTVDVSAAGSTTVFPMHYDPASWEWAPSAGGAYRLRQVASGTGDAVYEVSAPAGLRLEHVRVALKVDTNALDNLPDELPRVGVVQMTATSGESGLFSVDPSSSVEAYIAPHEIFATPPTAAGDDSTYQVIVRGSHGASSYGLVVLSVTAEWIR